MNLFLMLLAFGPMSNLFKNIFGNNLAIESFSNGFNYTTFMDMVNNHGEAFNIAVIQIIAFLIPYLLWSIFSSGGIVEVAKNYSLRSSLYIFWKGAASYFFRYSRLSIYVLIILGLVGFILIKIFLKDGLSPFAFYSENILITRFWWVLTIFIIIAFFVATFRDITKVIVAYNDEEMIISQSLYTAFKRTFTIRYLLLSLLNVIILILVFGLYLFLKSILSNALIPLIIISQLFLVIRITYRIVRLGSLEQQFKLEQENH